MDGLYIIYQGKKYSLNDTIKFSPYDVEAKLQFGLYKGNDDYETRHIGWYIAYGDKIYTLPEVIENFCGEKIE
jgi:hypothetical protein